MHCVLCNISKDTIITKVECICIANTRCIVRGLENSASASLLIYSDYALQKCSLLTAYALNYLKLQVLKLTLIGIVLYNAIKEYYNDRIRKIIYFYSYTIENNYYDNNEETRVQLRELLEKIYNILLREFCRANNFIKSIIYNDDDTV
ncbi:hypothetical protein HBI16_215400 [Parastagonospora nodorum]|nr:hypothetical protein HBI16_215400 [Parastagonospora nodorum]